MLKPVLITALVVLVAFSLGIGMASCEQRLDATPPQPPRLSDAVKSPGSVNLAITEFCYDGYVYLYGSTGIAPKVRMMVGHAQFVACPLGAETKPND